MDMLGKCQQALLSICLHLFTSVYISYLTCLSLFTTANICLYRLLPKEQDDGTLSCIDTIYDECMYGALVEHMESQTQNENGCTTPWIMINKEEGATNICKMPENINITFWESWNRVTNQLNDCPVPCRKMFVSLGAKNYLVITNYNKISKHWNFNHFRPQIWLKFYSFLGTWKL
jgi:hypothetical protein